MPPDTILQVALDAPLRRIFDYRAPVDPGRCRPQPGARVRVPFGRRQLVGVILGLTDHSEVPADKLRAAIEVLDAEPVFDARLRELLEFASRYYHHPVGEVVAAALPKLARDGAAAIERVERWFVTHTGLAALAAGDIKRAPKQRAVLEFIAAQTAAENSAGISANDLDTAFPAWRPTVAEC